MTKYLLEHGYLSRARHFYHTAIGTATQYPDRRKGRHIIKEAFPFAQRWKLRSLAASVRWLGIYFPRLYRVIYRMAMKVRNRMLSR